MKRSILTTLRDFVPIRTLTRHEAMRVAELQAHRLHELLGITGPPFPTAGISELPRVQVEWLSPIPVSGSTHWASNRWLIVLNGAESATRNRFSMAHEYKHILDHRFVDVLYRGVNELERPAWIEQICDYFAGCLLMPRAWVKSAYCSGTQDLDQLARRFQVSQSAMNVRLQQIGLADRPKRCSTMRPDWALRVFARTGTPVRYERTAPLISLGS